ncbi:hypothetical protein [Paenibacillus humicola]|uniref:hypothetical protein n=1 Tax=Paenibacillus humicola TaxID=3110540 RepID=UPI00237B745C|nr:hypothetical protein [Paenibacillus humicola]
MKQSFETLMESTGDLLHRVRKYDRDLMHSEEIKRLGETHALIGQAIWVADSDPLRERVMEKLIRMKIRLMTLLENLLYTA